MSSTEDFSRFHSASRFFNSSFSLAISFSATDNLSFFNPSFFSAARSISSVKIWRFRFEIDSGSDSISSFNFDIASSIRSMTLSGNFLSGR